MRSRREIAAVELRVLVVVTVGEGRNEGDLFHLEPEAERNRLPEGTEDRHRASRAYPIDRRVDRSLGAGGVEDDVVLASGRRPRAETHPGLEAIGPVREEIDLRAVRPARGDGAQSDRAGADHQRGGPRFHPGAVDAVQRDGERLDQAGVFDAAHRPGAVAHTGARPTRGPRDRRRGTLRTGCRGRTHTAGRRRRCTGRNDRRGSSATPRPVCRRRESPRIRDRWSPRRGRAKPGGGRSRRSPMRPPRPRRPHPAYRGR